MCVDRLVQRCHFRGVHQGNSLARAQTHTVWRLRGRRRRRLHFNRIPAQYSCIIIYITWIFKFQHCALPHSTQNTNTCYNNILICIQYYCNNNIQSVGILYNILYLDTINGGNIFGRYEFPWHKIGLCVAPSTAVSYYII